MKNDSKLDSARAEFIFSFLERGILFKENTNRPSPIQGESCVCTVVVIYFTYGLREKFASLINNRRVYRIRELIRFVAERIRTFVVVL